LQRDLTALTVALLLIAAAGIGKKQLVWKRPAAAPDPHPPAYAVAGLCVGVGYRLLEVGVAGADGLAVAEGDGAGP
jgi:hypothetical protein